MRGYTTLSAHDVGSITVNKTVTMFDKHNVKTGYSRQLTVRTKQGDLLLTLYADQENKLDLYVKTH